MEKKEMVEALTKKLKMDSAQAEQAVNMVILEIASPYIFKKPGGEVGFLDNSCHNNCKEPSAIQTHVKPM
jgi:hypothetical protein